MHDRGFVQVSGLDLCRVKQEVVENSHNYYVFFVPLLVFFKFLMIVDSQHDSVRYYCIATMLH